MYLRGQYEKGMVYLKCEEYSSAIPIFSLLTDVGGREFEASAALRFKTDGCCSSLYLDLILLQR